ncbi:MAG: transcription elongation GreA/GreB family factor, partial [Psychroserpens sp.]
DKIDENLKGVQKAFADFVDLPENTPDEIEAKTQAYNKLTNGAKYWHLKSLADAQVAQFFIPKTPENKNRLTTDAQYRSALNSGLQLADQGASLAIAAKKQFFHWFLEFPEVFGKGGFDCILGNPPFLNGLKITELYGDNYNLYLVSNYVGGSKKVDLSAYFFRRDFEIINDSGFFSLISTNTISQGKTREGGLDYILRHGGQIIFGAKSIKWPGAASVIISLTSITKRQNITNKYLNNNVVSYISSLLEDEDESPDPIKLEVNSKFCFQGSNPYGKQFEVTKKLMQHMVGDFSENSKVIRPYIGGRELNSRIKNEPDRWIINFHEMSLNEARKFDKPFKHVEEFVKPERDTRDLEKYPRLVKEWWKFWHSRQSLYLTIKDLKPKFLLGRSRVSNLHIIDLFPPDWTYSEALVVFVYDDYKSFGVLQSNLHEAWLTKYASTMKNDVRYIVSDCFETYPKPNNIDDTINIIVREYLVIRNTYKMENDLGLTKLYRDFHSIEIVSLEINLIRKLHQDMDEEVLSAYGWQEDTEKWGEAIDLRHDFYEVDYLPENDRVRYTIHPDARKEVLKRLLLLNHERFEEEVQQGLHKKKDVEAYYKQKNEEVPEGLPYSDVKTKSIKTKAKKKAITESAKSANPLIAEEQVTNKLGEEVGMHSKVNVKNLATGVVKKIRIASSKTGQSDMEYETMPITEPFALAMFNRKTGSKFKHEGVQYEIIGVV